MWTRRFWQALTERAISAAAIAAAATMQASVFDWFDADWQAVGGVALTAGILSVLKSLGVNALQINGPGPSLTGAEVVAEP